MNHARQIDLIAVSLMAVGTVFGLLFWADLPSQLAIHWGPGGSPDSFVSKPAAIFGLFALGVGIVALTRLAPDSMTNTPGGENASILFVGLVFAWLQGMVVVWNLGYRFDIWLGVLPILVMAGLLVLVSKAGFTLG